MTMRPLLSKQRPILLAFARNGFPAAVLVICSVLLWNKLGEMDMALVRASLGAVAPSQWILAAIATWGSFWAIGHYDAVWHRIMGTAVPANTARLAAMKAIAIAQIIGFGAVTASLIRWRLMPQLTLWQATRLSAAVTLTFSLCWAIIGVLAIWWLGQAAFGFSILPMVAVLGVVLMAAEFIRRRWLPQLSHRDIVRLLGWTAADLVLAALALYVLLPDDIGLSLATVMAAYVIALGAGLVSNTPGGAGAFDLMLLGLLPLDAPEPLVAALVAFRLIYYALPAALAVISLAQPARTALSDRLALPAQWGLAQQSGALRRVGAIRLFVKNLPGVAAVLGPVPCDATVLKSLRRSSLLRAQIPALYNCRPEIAAFARKAGWHVRRTTIEAVINPTTWMPGGSDKRALRRKLRQADAAGVYITPAGADLPLPEMTTIAGHWAQARGGEMGATIGRYCPTYVSGQKVFLIWQADLLVGFISFHQGRDGWMLDLIRHDASTPTGAIHKAIAAAIAEAAAQGVTRLSLATVPDPAHTPTKWWQQKAGLIQFKNSFGAEWQPRYHAAPTALGFWLSGLIIGLAVHRPVATLPMKAARISRMLWQSGRSRRIPVALDRAS